MHSVHMAVRAAVVYYSQASHLNTFILKTENRVTKTIKIKIEVILGGVSESMDRRGCAILALEVVPKNLIFA